MTTINGVHMCSSPLDLKSATLFPVDHCIEISLSFQMIYPSLPPAALARCRRPYISMTLPPSPPGNKRLYICTHPIKHDLGNCLRIHDGPGYVRRVVCKLLAQSSWSRRAVPGLVPGL